MVGFWVSVVGNSLVVVLRVRQDNEVGSAVMGLVMVVFWVSVVGDMLVSLQDNGVGG